MDIAGWVVMGAIIMSAWFIATVVVVGIAWIVYELAKAIITMVGR